MLPLDELLAPIAGAHRCGDDLSFSPEYDAIQDSRRADDPSLDQGVWVTDLKSADWPAAAAQCTRLLQQRSKDLQLAAWWAEAHTQTQGFAGLAQGYLLMAGLCERYWDDVHPQVEGADLEQGIGNLDWLLTHSSDWLRRLPLVQAPQGHYSLADFEARASTAAAVDPRWTRSRRPIAAPRTSSIPAWWPCCRHAARHWMHWIARSMRAWARTARASPRCATCSTTCAIPPAASPAMRACWSTAAMVASP